MSLSDDDLKYMTLALAFAATFPDTYRGKAVGAIIVNAQGEMIGSGVRKTYKNVGEYEDKTPHAEFAAIQNAERAHPGTDFSTCTLYTTMEPCLERRQNPAWYPYPSCAAVIIGNKIGRIVIGAVDSHSSSHKALIAAGIKVDFVPQELELARQCAQLTAFPVIPPGQEENLRKAGDLLGLEVPSTPESVNWEVHETDGDMHLWFPSPRARVCIDLVVFNVALSHVLLVLRGEEPFKGQWCVPGGMMREHEHVQMALMRKLQEETGITACETKFMGVYSDICKDPRGWTVSLVHTVINHTDERNIKPGKFEKEVKWFALSDPMPDIVLEFENTIRIAHHFEKLKQK